MALILAGITTAIESVETRPRLSEEGLSQSEPSKTSSVETPSQTSTDYMGATQPDRNDTQRSYAEDAILAPSADNGKITVIWTANDVLAARATASWCTQQIIDGEVGGGVTRNGVVYPPYSPYSPGAAGEVGPGQLLPVYGKLPAFVQWAERRWEYADPHNPY